MTVASPPRLSAVDDRVLLGIGLMLGFCITAPLIDVTSKLAAATLSVGLITTARFVVQAAIMLPVCLALGHGLRTGPGVLGQLCLRAILLTLSTYCFVAAIQVMPIADALAIAFVEPFIILLLGKALFGDEVGPRRLMASIVGFGGCLLVIQPSFAAFGPVAIFPLGTALTFALYMLVTRSLSRRMHPIPIQFHTALIAAFLCLPLLVIGDAMHIESLKLAMPSGFVWVWLPAVGLASALAHLLMSYALRYAPSATLAPLHYLEIISAGILGFWVFGDLPNLLALSGMMIIVGCGLYIFFRERQLSRHVSAIARPPVV